MEWVRFNKTGFPPTPLWDQLLARELYGQECKKKREEKKEEGKWEGRGRGRIEDIFLQRHTRC
jgi:hypothetical protein